MSIRKKAKSKSKRPTYCIRHIRSTTCYTVDEAAKTLKVTPSYIRKFIRDKQLRGIDDRKPVLIHGTDLQQCASLMLSRRKVKMGPHQFYCIRCRRPTFANTSTLSLITNMASKPCIVGECMACGDVIHRITSVHEAKEKFEAIKNTPHRLEELTVDSRQMVDAYDMLVRSKPQYNSLNERLIYDFLVYCNEARGMSSKTIKTYSKSLLDYQRFIERKDISIFDKELAKRYKKHLVNHHYSPSTRHGRLNTVKCFMVWLKQQPGFKKKYQHTDIDYLNISRKERGIMNSRKPLDYPMQEVAAGAVFNMLADTPKQKRDRAIMAVLLLTGLRDGVIHHLKLRHLNLAEGYIIQAPEDLPIKCDVYFHATFLPLDNHKELLEIISDYYHWLINEYRFSSNDPLFPKLALKTKSGLFEEGDFSREFMRDSGTTRNLCKKSFKEYCQKSYSPHRLRHTLFCVAKKICKTPEQIKAWSQAMGHKSTKHMIETYGQIDHTRQQEILQAM